MSDASAPSRDLRVTIKSAQGLAKKDWLRNLTFVCSRLRKVASDPSALGLPDPFAVLTVDGEQTHTTKVAKKTLNPKWNHSFVVYPFFCYCLFVSWLANTMGE